jgi:hypothetical protein
MRSSYADVSFAHSACDCSTMCNVQEDDPKKFVIARKFENKAGKTVTKRPKIQRLITPVRLQRKRARANVKKQAQEKAKVSVCIHLHYKTYKSISSSNVTIRTAATAF